MQSCVRLKLLTRQVINECVGGVLDIEKVNKLVPKDTGFTWSDIRAALAAIAFILTQSARVDIDPMVLNAELQQLGLPKENSDGISRPYRIHRERLHAQALADSLHFPRLLSLDWCIDAVVHTSSLGLVRQAGSNAAANAASGVGEPVVHVRLGVSHDAGQRPPRVPAADAGSTPLLLAFSAAAAGRTDDEGANGDGTPSSATSRSAAAAGFGTLADRAASDAALLALGIRPLGLGHGPDHAHSGSGGIGSGANSSSTGSNNMLSPLRGGASGVGSSASNGDAGLFGSDGKAKLTAAAAANAGTATAAHAAVAPGRYIDFVMPHTKATALLGELKVARTILGALGAASGGAAQPQATR